LLDAHALSISFIIAFIVSSEILSRASPFLLISTMSNEIGFDIESTEKCQKIKEVKQYKHIIKDSLNDYNKNLILNKIKNLNGSNKIYLYKFLKQNENEMEYYLSHPDKNVRLILTKFRLSEHKLVIKISRNLKIPRDQRLCAICNVLEGEFHFFFECKRNTNNRNILYQYFQNIYSNFLELNHEEKLTKILNPSTPEQIRTVMSFIRQSLELREGDSSQS
jgi:hypothetical protein